MEKLNIVGKRSGKGFVAHKSRLVHALSMSQSDRVSILDMTLGRKGLLNYIKALAGSNIVKIVPAGNGVDSEAHNGDKRLKVVCGNLTSYLEDSAWIGEKTPMTIAEVRVSPANTVKPNIGGLELSEALNRVLPFTAKEDTRPVLQCVLLKAGGGKLTLVSADGYRLASVTLDYDGKGEALIDRDDLKGLSNALRKAQRVNFHFQKSGKSLTGMKVCIDTEVIQYRFIGSDGNFPDWGKLIPADTTTTAHLDTVEAIKAVASLKALTDGKEYPIDLHLNGGIVMSSPDDTGQVTIPADIEGGEVKVRLDGGYLAQALRACGGMVDFKVKSGDSPVLFETDGYKLVVMPMLTGESKPETEAEPEAETAEPETEAEPEAETAEPETEAETVEPEAETAGNGEKPSRKRKVKEPVAV